MSKDAHPSHELISAGMEGNSGLPGPSWKEERCVLVSGDSNLGGCKDLGSSRVLALLRHYTLPSSLNCRG